MKWFNFLKTHLVLVLMITHLNDVQWLLRKASDRFIQRSFHSPLYNFLRVSLFQLPLLGILNRLLLHQSQLLVPKTCG